MMHVFWVMCHDVFNAEFNKFKHCLIQNISWKTSICKVLQYQKQVVVSFLVFLFFCFQCHATPKWYCTLIAAWILFFSHILHYISVATSPLYPSHYTIITSHSHYTIVSCMRYTVLHHVSINITSHIHYTLCDRYHIMVYRAIGTWYHRCNSAMDTWCRGYLVHCNWCWIWWQGWSCGWYIMQWRNDYTTLLIYGVVDICNANAV